MRPESPGPVNVLFTSAGRRVELLRAFRRAYEALNLPGQIVATDIQPLAPALQIADRPYLVPRLDDPEYPDVLAEICRREQIHRVFPLIDPDVPTLARHRARLEATGTRLAVVSSGAAEIAGDKWETARFFQRLDLPTPRSWLPGDLDPARAPYPLFIKPRRGSASQHTFPVCNARELAFFSEYVPDPILQEHLPGPEITSDVVCDMDGTLLAVVLRQRIEARGGEVVKGVTVHHAEILEGCRRIAEALPAVGPITVQCLLRGDNTPCFTEINARWGGGAPLGFAAGADGPRYLLAHAAGLLVAIPPIGDYAAGLYQTRFDDTFFVSEDARAQMASRRL